MHPATGPWSLDGSVAPQKTELQSLAGSDAGRFRAKFAGHTWSATCHPNLVWGRKMALLSGKHPRKSDSGCQERGALHYRRPRLPNWHPVAQEKTCRIRCGGLFIKYSSVIQPGMRSTLTKNRGYPWRQLSEVLSHELPVHQIVEKSLDELGALVAVVDIVGMFPHIHAQQSFVGGGERCAGCAHICNV